MSDWRDNAADQNLRMAAKMLEQQGEVNRLRAEAAALRQRYAELERAARAVSADNPLIMKARDEREREVRWLELLAALDALDSPCTCPTIDVSTLQTPPDVRDVVKGLEPTCPEHGKGMRRVDSSR